MLRVFHSYDSLTYDLGAVFNRKNMKNMHMKMHAYLSMEEILENFCIFPCIIHALLFCQFVND